VPDDGAVLPVTPPTYRTWVVAPVRPVDTYAVPVIVDDAAMVVTLVNAPVMDAPPVVTVNPAATVSTPAFVKVIALAAPAALRKFNPAAAFSFIYGCPVPPVNSIPALLPFINTLPDVTVMPPLATVNPVRLPRVPVIVEFPVMVAPPLATVNPVNPVSVPAIVLLPVTAMAALNVCNAENVCAVPLCAA
jgi:hypothetical protein